jgi:tetratricopeptide (TPR) repeat protein
MRASPTPEAYYYLALSHQEMKEVDKALYYLQKGMERFPRDAGLGKALAMAYYERGDEEKARPLFENLLRMNPEDRQVRFLLERLKKP